MNKKKHILIFILLFLVFAGTGFLRGYLFKMINARIAPEKNNLEYLHQIIQKNDPFNNFSDKQLYIVKWALTGFFFIGYFSISACTIWLLFRKKYPVVLVAILYLTLLVLSGLLIGTGYVSVNLYPGCFKLARVFTGIAQSPVILMLAILAFWFLEKKRNSIYSYI